jgi:hypothetical protein
VIANATATTPDKPALDDAGWKTPTADLTNYQFNPSALAATLSGSTDGTPYYTHVYVRDAAGNISAGKTGTITMDTTKPSISAASNDTVSNHPNMDFTASEAYCYYVSALNSTINDKVPLGNQTVFTDKLISNVTGSVNLDVFDFYLLDRAGNKSTNHYSATFNGTNFLSGALASYSRWERIGTGVQSVLTAIRRATSSRPATKVSFADAIYDSVDPEQRSKAEAAQNEALSSDIGFKPIEARYSVSVNSRAGGIDSSGLSLLGRSASAAAQAAGRTSEIAMEARASAPASANSVQTKTAPSAQAQASPASSGRPVTGIQTPTEASSSAKLPPVPNGNAPGDPAKVPARRVDLYVSQRENRREESSESPDDDEQSDMLKV